MGVSGSYSALKHLEAQLEKMGASPFKRGLVLTCAEEYRQFMVEGFESGHGPYGEQWAPVKLRDDGGTPLNDAGRLKAAVSVPASVNADGFVVKVSHPGARVHQYGATIKPKRGRFLRFRGVSYVPRKRGGARRVYGDWIYARQVTIPARPYAPLAGMPPELNARLNEAVSEFIKAMMQ